mmetsp:Transcript_69376/g.224311  ORF Transcript_69376/g.224311 Transcript_69376/m.224311 type:complete len:254 (+) Transcript_69376:83-844(+)
MGPAVPPLLVGDAVDPNVLVQELPVEVTAHRVVNETLLLLGGSPSLVLEDRVVVPLPLQGDVRLQQGIPLHDLVPSGPLVQLSLLLLPRLFLLLALFLDLCELAHELLCVIFVVIFPVVGLLRAANSPVFVSVLGEGVVLNGCGGLPFLLRIVLAPLPVVPGLTLAALQVLSELPPRAALLRHALAGLASLEGEHVGSIAVGDLCRLRDEDTAAGIGATRDGGSPCRSVRGRHRGTRRCSCQGTPTFVALPQP